MAFKLIKRRFTCLSHQKARLLGEQDSPSEGNTKAEASRFSNHTSPALLPGVAGSVKGSQANSITAARWSLLASDAEVTLWHDARRSDIQPSEKTDMREREAVQCNTGLHMKGRKSHKAARVGSCVCVCARVHTHSHMQTKAREKQIQCL